MIHEVGVDVTIKRVLWVKARPDYKPLFSILERMHQDADLIPFFIQKYC
jgi:hypothetical protein